MRIAYLCSRLGPYHVAQLNAAHRHADIVALEYSPIDPVYAWDTVDDASDFQRVILFKDTPVHRQPAAVVTSAMWTALEQVRPEVVAMMGWNTPSALAALRWCVETQTPAIMMSDSQECDRPRRWWKEAIKRRIVRLTAAGFVGGLPHAAYLRSLGMAAEAIVPGCDVVDNEHFAAGARAARQRAVALRQQLSLPEKYFLASSRFVPEKNLPNLLRAYARYLRAAKGDPWHLVLLGDGGLKEQIVTIRHELGLTGMVILPGFIQYPELPLYYGLAQAFVLASTTEPWGLVVNEAMASGLPVLVSSRCGCAPDLVKHGDNGFVFDPSDIDALAQHLSCLASDGYACEVMGNASRRIVKDWDLNLFARSLCRAAELAKSAPRRVATFRDTALLRALARWLPS